MKLRDSPVVAKQVFYEWNRNTITIDGKDDDYIEQLYAYMDSVLAPSYNKIKNQDIIRYDSFDLFQIMFFSSALYWRNPFYDAANDAFIKSQSKESLPIKIFNVDDSTLASEEFYAEMRRRAGFTDMIKLVMPIYDFVRANKQIAIDNWKLYSSNSSKGYHILGDSPFIFQIKESSNFLESEFILPLTSSKLICHTNGARIPQLSPAHRINVDVMIFLQSEKMIVGPNKEYLEKIRELASPYDSASRVESLRKLIFQELA